jgi:hypothetical protein
VSRIGTRATRKTGGDDGLALGGAQNPKRRKNQSERRASGGEGLVGRGGVGWIL